MPKQFAQSAHLAPARYQAPNVTPTSCHAATPVTCEPLEERCLFSKTGPFIDAGDQRWLYEENRAEKLLRVTSEVTVGFEPSSMRRIRRLADALTADDGALAGYQVEQTFDNRYTVLFHRTARGFAPPLETLQQKIDGFPAIKHLSPTFARADDHVPFVVFDALYVDLKAGVDPAPVFAKGFRDWSTDLVSFNAYNATLRRGGAIDALRVAEKLRTESYIDSASADIAVTVIPAAPTKPAGAAAQSR